ncbi:TPM domain-containing protein [Sphingomonas sp. 7/4-4]|uniref:TPM domain-containing protein n=1 Tax=Sphingomonas sp. 7/4-4 TaxID=3018446 RepID=UPI0022F40676|nr:TPM domain-containing protein [Sphingomonas sp. 7/4-4]WBY06995.1 TPM domain-containing protein [Sphingomonas sp. 7/4-4]
MASKTALPALTGRVVDDANLLAPEQEAGLVAKSAELEKATGHQLVVVTIPSLHGQDIATFGVDLGRRWGVGRKDIDDGVLLIVAPNERKARIEVGYGLEKALRDEEAGRILRDAILPAFRAGDMPKGIAAGVDGIIREIGPGAGA